MNSTINRKTLPYLIALFLLLNSCSPFNPKPIEKSDFLKRAEVISEKGPKITVAALSAKESKKIFSRDISEKNIQPVWIKIENDSTKPKWIFPIRTDPNYYSPAEVAYMNRFLFSQKKSNQLLHHLKKLSIPLFIAPNKTTSGFIYTEVDPGLKYIEVATFGTDGMKNFRTVVEVPGLKADYQQVDFKNLYTNDEYIDCNLATLKKELQKLPCCATNKNGDKNADPLNIVLIGDMKSTITALSSGGWDVTEVLSSGSIWRTIRSFIYGIRYRHAPVSSLYVFGRGQDAAFQKARSTINERNHLRIWLTPLKLNGVPVWIGQISRDIGVKLTLKTGFLTTHVIDSDIDNDRYYLLQNLTDSKAISKIGYVKGGGESTVDNTRYNLGGDPYYTDGLRAVMECSDNPNPISKMSFFNWEFPNEVAPFIDGVSD